MSSPWVQRMLNEQRANNHACLMEADATLGDKVAADRFAFRPKADEPRSVFDRELEEWRDAQHPMNIPGTNVPMCSDACDCT